MADAETELHTVELDLREIRSLHFAGSLVADALREAVREAGDDLAPLPDGRKVHACDSALMKLELILVREGAEL